MSLQNGSREFLQITGMEQLIALLKFVAPMSAGLEAHLRKIIRPMTYKKGDVILPMGSVCNQIFYIESGIVRSFGLKEGQEISRWFQLPGDIVIAVVSWHRRTASLEQHVALMDCLCWVVSWDEIEATYELFPEFERHGRLIEGEYYTRLQELMDSINNMSALERYTILMDKNSTLVSLIPNKYLASYLGVKGRTLTKIKKDYSDKKKSSNRKKKDLKEST
jgi:CRP-like cAMP-binding protein